MSSIFSTNRLLPHLKRRSRSRPKHETALPRGKPLDILPELMEEEDEPRISTSSTSSYISPYGASQSVGGSATLGSRNPEASSFVRIRTPSDCDVLSGAGDLAFDEPPRPAPKPPVSTPGATLDSPKNRIHLRMSHFGQPLEIPFDFPSPPPEYLSSLRRDHSPTPSESSFATSSGSSSSSRMFPTPPTSDDESQSQSCSRLARAPTYKSQRASVCYVKSVPNLRQSLNRKPSVEESDEEDGWSDAEELLETIGLSSYSPPETPTPETSGRNARPDSIVLPQSRSLIVAQSHSLNKRRSRALPPVPPLSIRARPHASIPDDADSELDPTFYQLESERQCERRGRRSFTIPSHPPPPPPIAITDPNYTSPIVKELEDLAEAAIRESKRINAYLSPSYGMESAPVTPSSAYIVSTPRMRPDPRMSIAPTDVDTFADGYPMEDSSISNIELIISGPSADLPTTPQSISIYSQSSMSVDSLPRTPNSAISSFDLDLQTPTPNSTTQFSSFTTTVSVDVSASQATSSDLADSTSTMRERNLRSRWSSSTLASEYNAHQHRQLNPLSPSAWKTRFHIGGSSSSSPSKSKSSKHTRPLPARPLPRVPKVPLSPNAKRSLDLEKGATLSRRDSSSSSRTASTDSGESISSNGLARKPIPFLLLVQQ